jgi:enamine deaminase RidA (YjgF/YER057c/UK114 family)
MKHFGLFLLMWLLVGLVARGQDIKRYDNPKAQILLGVDLPANKKLFLTSGIVASPADTTAAAGTPARYGDTYAQSLSALKKIEDILKAAGLGMKDVVFLRIYLVPDKFKNGQTDFEGWFRAYGKFFVNETNPNKVARTTVGIYALANPDLLVEIEAVAAY